MKQFIVLALLAIADARPAPAFSSNDVVTWRYSEVLNSSSAPAPAPIKSDSSSSSEAAKNYFVLTSDTSTPYVEEATLVTSDEQTQDLALLVDATLSAAGVSIEISQNSESDVVTVRKTRN